MHALVILISLLLACFGTLAESQTSQQQNFDTVKIYQAALETNGEAPRGIDPEALQLSRKLADAQHTLIVVDQELLVVGHALGAFVTGRNPGKDRERRLFVEQEMIPTLFQNFEVFRDLFAISVADTFSVADLKGMASQGDLANQKLDIEKSKAAAVKFHNAALVLGGWLLEKLTADPGNRLKPYGLK
jgi:hypothetical protein